MLFVVVMWYSSAQMINYSSGHGIHRTQHTQSETQSACLCIYCNCIRRVVLHHRDGYSTILIQVSLQCITRIVYTTQIHHTQPMHSHYKPHSSHINFYFYFCFGISFVALRVIHDLPFCVCVHDWDIVLVSRARPPSGENIVFFRSRPQN